MRYIHAVLLLHSSDQKIDEESLTRVLEATGREVNQARIKTIVETLSEVDIDEAIKIMAVVKKEEVKEEEKKEPEDLSGGLDQLFK